MKATLMAGIKDLANNNLLTKCVANDIIYA